MRGMWMINCAKLCHWSVGWKRCEWVQHGTLDVWIETSVYWEFRQSCSPQEIFTSVLPQWGRMSTIFNELQGHLDGCALVKTQNDFILEVEKWTVSLYGLHPAYPTAAHCILNDALNGRLCDMRLTCTAIKCECVCVWEGSDCDDPLTPGLNNISNHIHVRHINTATYWICSRFTLL